MKPTQALDWGVAATETVVRSPLYPVEIVRTTPHVPVVMLTADGAERDMQIALQSGAQDYILKPFNPRELTTRLQRFLKQVA